MFAWNIIVLYITISMMLSCLIFYLCFKKKEKNYIQKCQERCIAYEKDLIICDQNLKHESQLRNTLEIKLKHELKNTYELNGNLISTQEKLKLLEFYQEKYEQIYQELHVQRNLNYDQKIKIHELEIRFTEYKLLVEEKEKLFSNQEKKMMVQFENLSNRVFEQNKSKMNEEYRLLLDRVLHPFRDQLDGFRNQIQDNFLKEEQMRHALTCEVHHLHQLNTKITQETVNLTKALKGNNKIQGNWGEVMLVRTLEMSGMREGYEFHLQISVDQNDGRKLKPDVIVHLPNGKDIIIDSKMSLIAYERYFNNSSDMTEQDLALHDHINSLRTHIKSLSKKDYQKLFGLNTLDYILMFVPIESALTIAIEKESSLLTYAMNANVMLVSPTTLLIALRTINNLWNYEYQNHHSRKIAEKAGRLYDKLRLFIDDLNKIGQYLNKIEITYSAAKNKLFEGKGNIVGQAESFRSFGVQVKHPIVKDNIIIQKES